MFYTASWGWTWQAVKRQNKSPCLSAACVSVSISIIPVLCSIMRLICAIWHIPIQMLIASRQQMRWHTVIIITDKLEIFIFCRQSPASLTFELFSWDFPVCDQYSSSPPEDQAQCSEFFISFKASVLLLLCIIAAMIIFQPSVCLKMLCFLMFSFFGIVLHLNSFTAMWLLGPAGYQLRSANYYRSLDENKIKWNDSKCLISTVRPGQV